MILRRPTLFLVLFLALQCAVTGLTAQETQRGIEVIEEQPRFEDSAAPVLEFDRTPVLPPSSLPTGDQLAAVPVVFVRQIVLDGSGVLSAEEVAGVVTPYEGRDVSIEELNEVRTRLSLLYFDKGFVNSGVVLPDQKITDGVIRFEEVLGRLSAVQLEGDGRLEEAWWGPQVQALEEQKILNINYIQDTLRVIEQDELIQRIEARLVPGSTVGESILHLGVVEASPWRVIVGVDNHRSPSLGAAQATFRVSHLSLTGHGDRAEVYANLAEGLGDFGLAYGLRVGDSGATLRGYFSAGDAEIVESPFDLVDIETEMRTWGVELGYPFWRSASSSLTGLLGVEGNTSESTLLGMPWSFSLGEIDGRAEAVAAIGGFEWTHRDVDQVWALRLTLRQGTDWFGADVNDYAPGELNGPDTDFLSLRGQLQYIRRLDWLDSELHLRSSFQFARDPLLPVEKMPIGGFYSVRGYRENILVRDNGFVASAEWRLPLFADRQRPDGWDWRSLTVAAFADYGTSWDQDTGLPSDEKERIYSIGAGAIWTPLPGLSGYVYYGEALNDLETAGDDLQDRGWHFRISYRL